MPADSRYPAIADYALLSDCHGAALVSSAGSLDWCCIPRFDARPVFSRLLDWDRGGYFQIAPTGRHEVARRYLPGTNILETRFRSGTGAAVLEDLMVIGRIEPEDDPLYDEPVARAEDRLIRTVKATDGVMELRVEYHPRFEYGQTCPYLTRTREGLVVAYGGGDALVLQSPLELELKDDGARGTLRLEPGDRKCFVLSYQQPHMLRPERLSDAGITAAFDATRRYWAEWSDRCGYHGPYREEVVRSALVLKALTSLPTGAIVAAPTTSLPEKVGGVRNWDYRYTWLRDAAHVLDSLFDLGYTAEGEAFMRWLHRTTAGRPEQLQILYSASGERMLPEVEIEGLDGYRGSRPVRIGNAAARQFQLDIYGDILSVAWGFCRREGGIDADLWVVLRRIVDYVIDVWERPDHGIWEVRTDPRQFVHSKVMAWVAVDRGIRLARARFLPADLDRWTVARDAMRSRILDEGVDEHGRITRAFGGHEPDASLLTLPLLGFLDADDDRVTATRDWIIEELEENGLLRRYRARDGLPGDEGAFLPCSFWLVQQLAAAGRADEGHRRLRRLLDVANDVGLFSEQLDPRTGELLGNFPQALTHIGVINAAVALRHADSAD